MRLSLLKYAVIRLSVFFFDFICIYFRQFHFEENSLDKRLRKGVAKRSFFSLDGTNFSRFTGAHAAFSFQTSFQGILGSSKRAPQVILVHFC